MDTKQPIERIPGTKAMAQRCDNAVRHFIEIATGLGVTEANARKALPVMLKLKVVKLDPINGRAMFSHGIYVAEDVINNAAGLAK